MTAWSKSLGSTPIMLGMSWPIWFIVWCVMWQWKAQSPGLGALNPILVVVRVVHERAVLGERELVAERLAGLDRPLRQAADAVHAVRDVDPVPVDCRRRREAVRDVDAHAVALDRLDRRPVDLAVVAPA